MASLAKRVFGEAEEIFIDKNGFTYNPILLDSSMELETEPNKEIIYERGKTYVKGVNLNSAIATFEKIDKEKYDSFKEDLFRRVLPEVKNAESICKMGRNGIIDTIIFEVMPYFIGKNRKCNSPEKKEGENAAEERILELINEKKIIPSEYYEKAERYGNYKELECILEKLNSIKETRFPEGIISPRDLENFMEKNLEARILNEKKGEIEKEIQSRKEIALKNRNYAAAMLYLKDAENFELDNFGFIKESQREYTAYIKTGEYALRDFSGRVYLFPSCKVGTHIEGDYGSLICYHPKIIERYKHPFLPQNCENQNICIRNREYEGKIGAKRITGALEAGKDTLLFGYFNKSDFNGYLYLNGIRRNHPYSDVNFDNYLISEDDPRIKSGEIIITNDPFIKSRRDDL